MRLALVLALTCACGGAPAHPERGGAVADGPFGDEAGFRPTSFVVQVTGHGRPIIFVPGLGCPGDVWRETVAHLGAGYEAHVLTLAGFAGQPPIREPLSATVRRELARYIRSRRLDHPILVGHSMGGFIAYWLAANLPEVVGPVVIVDAGPALSGDLDDAKQLRARWTHASDEEFAQQATSMYAGMSTDAKRMAPIAAAAAKSDRRALGDAIYELMTTDLTAAVAEIRAPVLVVLADGAYQQRIAAQVAAIPQHQVVALPHTHHFVMLDDPPGFYRALDAFLAAHPPGKASPRSAAPAPRVPTRPR